MMKLEQLVIGLLDISRDMSDQRVARKYRDFTISWTRYDYRDEIVEGASVNDILNKAATAGYRWCLILPYGHIISEHWSPDGAPDKGFFSALESYMERDDFFVAGPIIGDAGAWYGFKHECLLVSLPAYRQLSDPDFDRDCTQPIEVPKVQPRTEQMISLLRPSTGSETHHPRLSGWNFIAASLRGGLPVVNFDANVLRGVLDLSAKCPGRTRAFADYLDAGIDRYCPREPPPELGGDQTAFLNVVHAQTRGARKGVFLWNIEAYGDIEKPVGEFRPPVTSLFSVAAGFKPNRILHTHGLGKSTRVVFFDYSQRALDIRKYIVNHWNGVDFPQFIEHLFHVFPHPETYYQLWNDCTPENVERSEIQRRWESELDHWGGARVFRDHWHDYQDCRHEYVCCDILTDPAPLFEHIIQEPNAIIWWSNAFFTMYGNWFHMLEERRRLYDEWIEQLARLNPNLYLCGSDYNNVNVNSVSAAAYRDAYRRADSTCLVPCRLSEAQIRM